MNDVSRPDVGQLRERLFIEHGRRLPNLANNSSHGQRSRPASHGDGRHMQGLDYRAGVDPFQSRLASRRGRREGANRPGQCSPVWPWSILAVLQLNQEVSHHRQVSLMCSGGLFLTVLSAFQRGGCKPEVVVGGRSQYDGGVFLTGSDSLRSARSVHTT